MDCSDCKEISQLLRQLRSSSGCLCGDFSPKSLFSSVLKKSSSLKECTYLSLGSFLRSLLRPLSESLFVCPIVFELIAALKISKISFLGLFYFLYKNSSSIRTKRIFGLVFRDIFRLLPGCTKCISILDYLTPIEIIELLSPPEIDESRLSFDPLCDPLRLIRSGENHAQKMDDIVVKKLASLWKGSTLSILSKSNLALEFWDSRVKTYSSSNSSHLKIFATSAVESLFDTYSEPFSNDSKENEAKKKKLILNIFNNILPYGSSLAIQSDVPLEAYSLSLKLIRLSKSPDYFQNLRKIPSVEQGLGGTTLDQNFEQISSTDKTFVRNVLLLHLKALAVVVREASSCSSSEESDASSCTQSFLESELTDIEADIKAVLNSLNLWISYSLGRDELELPSFLNNYVLATSDSDETLVEGLLCALDIHTGAKLSYNSVIPPEVGFFAFCDIVSWDYSVLLDFLVSDETHFLLYFLRFLKFFKIRNNCDKIKRILEKISESLKKLTDKSLFPYDIAPVQKRLKDVLESPMIDY